MYSALPQKKIFFILLYCFFTNSTIIPEQESKTPKTFSGVVESFAANAKRTQYVRDVHRRYEVPLQNLRRMNEPPDLNTYGFTYQSGRHVEGMENWAKLSEEELIDKHEAALEADSVAFVQKVTRAPLAISYSAQFRKHKDPPEKETVSMIHSDLSPKGANFMKSKLQRDFLESKDLEEQNFGKLLSKGHHDVVMYNVWRPLKKVEDNPLALCDWRSVSNQDQKYFGITPTDLPTSIQVWDYKSHQNWHFLPGQEPHEVYVFIQHDSRAKDGHGISVPHAAFLLTKNDEDHPKRMSFECRVIALFPKKGKLERLHRHFKSIFSQNIFGRKQTLVNN